MAELNKRPLDPLAIDVVFDALARSKAAHRRPQPYPKPQNLTLTMTLTLTLTLTGTLTLTVTLTNSNAIPDPNPDRNPHPHPNAILPLTLAVARTQAGIVAREACDARRAAYEDEDGGFDAAPFDADLAGGRLKYLFSFLLFPGQGQG